MNTSITKGIKVSVVPKYQDTVERESVLEYLFSYEVTIENNSNQRVQLMSRQWKIFDSNNSYRIVEGDGVIGKQPILNPDELHSYQSWCPLNSGMGYMKGYYIMKDLDLDEEFKVKIPRFNLVAPEVCN